MWFQVELPKPETITEVQFDSTGGGGRGGRGGAGRAGQPGAPGAPGAAPAAPPAPVLGYPRGYKVETSMNGTTWTPVAEGQGTGSPTIITFKPTQAKFVRISQTATIENAPPFTIAQLRVYRSSAAR
jgi:F5/8 type C domain